MYLKRKDVINIINKYNLQLIKNKENIKINYKKIKVYV